MRLERKEEECDELKKKIEVLTKKVNNIDNNNNSKVSQQQNDIKKTVDTIPNIQNNSNNNIKYDTSSSMQNTTKSLNSENVITQAKSSALVYYII